MSDDRPLESRWMDRTSGGVARLAAECLEKQIDGASQGVTSDFSGIMKAVHLIIEQAKAEIRAELMPDFTPKPATDPEPDPEPAPPDPEWEVFLTYHDFYNRPTGNVAKIGRYATEHEASNIAQLLNNLTGHAYLFEYEQV